MDSIHSRTVQPRLFRFSLILTQKEFFDIITGYLRFTDKNFFQRQRQDLVKVGLRRGELRQDFISAPSYGQGMQRTSFFFFNYIKDRQQLIGFLL